MTKTKAKAPAMDLPVPQSREDAAQQLARIGELARAAGGIERDRTPGRMVKRKAAAALGLSSSACTTIEPVCCAGFSIQKVRKAGNSSPFGSAVRIDRPRAESP